MLTALKLQKRTKTGEVRLSIYIVTLLSYVLKLKCYFLDPNLASMSLNDCLEEFGRSQSQPHNAMEDAENLQFLCREMSKRLGYKNYQTYLHFNRDEIF